MLLNKNLLDEWGYDDKMWLDQQDEEIIFAEIANLELFLDAIDNSDYLQTKKKTFYLQHYVCFIMTTVLKIYYTQKKKTLNGKPSSI